SGPTLWRLGEPRDCGTAFLVLSSRGLPAGLSSTSEAPDLDETGGNVALMLHVSAHDGRNWKKRLLSPHNRLLVEVLFEPGPIEDTPLACERILEALGPDGPVWIVAPTGKAIAYRLRDSEGVIQVWTPFSQR